MSHIDELDEFEAELELALKKEYTAVFPLFRYCVLTQDPSNDRVRLASYNEKAGQARHHPDFVADEPVG